MHEVRVTVPAGAGPAVAKVALGCGIERVSVSQAHVHGPDRDAEVVSVETSTPRACAFTKALMTSGLIDARESSITTRELRSILDMEPAGDVTYPLVEPTVEISQDLWQLNHVTSSYLGRTCAGALLLAYGMLKDDAVSIVVAALFLPFLSPLLAVSLGLWTREGRLARLGVTALVVSTAVSVAAGAAAALLIGGPMRYAGFKALLLNAELSAVIGAAGGLAASDDAGRRYLIGVAAAAQSGVSPVWAGIGLVLGFPESGVTAERFATFGINIAVILAVTMAAYGLVGIRHRAGTRDAR